ncbi:hypothetical protein O3P69_001365 [Scylla paramamosain]|uniref:Uncharacterized protein n=1 Tax=Scylla paramamosain TaxID=85552 RepID=A0AAW0UUI1_SCYPA
MPLLVDLGGTCLECRPEASGNPHLTWSPGQAPEEERGGGGWGFGEVKVRLDWMVAAVVVVVVVVVV